MRLQELREQAALTQGQLAAAMDVQQPTVSYWEAGKTKPLKKYRVRLAGLLGCSVETLEQALEETVSGC